MSSNEIIQVLIGNIVMVGSAYFILKSTKKDKKSEVLKFQTAECCIGLIAHLILGAYSGALMTSIAITRNFIVFKKLDKRVKFLKYVIVSITVIVGVALAINRGNRIYDYLPVLAVIIYTIAVFESENVNKIKSALALNVIAWGIYNIICKNYVGAVVNVVILSSCIKEIYKSVRTERKNGEYIEQNYTQCNELG